MKRSTTWVAATCMVWCVLAWTTGIAWPQTETKTHVLKVFLADFDDVPHPARYSREYFDELMFGLDGPRQTPEGRALSGSVREYFLNVSEGRIDIEGEVVNWVRIPRNITEIPHWKREMKPFGESWPVIVAETLRGHGIVGEDAREKVRLQDGRLPDLLVFLNTDWGTGAVNRGWGHLKEVLEKMKLGDLWDDGWSALPSPYSSYSATKWRKAPPSGPDGTIDKVAPESELELFPLSVMMHEMGHQLAGWPDLYGPAYEPWGVFDVMGGPAASTHFPMSVSAYLRVRSGWMQYTQMPRRTCPGLQLHPLETHKEALCFSQGPGQESIIAENRWCLKYPREYGDPPVNEGPRLLFYRLDPAGRRRMMYGNTPQGKITTVIRRSEHYGEVWGSEGFAELSARTTPSSRNSLGELWWEFLDLRPEPDGALRLDARFAATDLVREYTAAAWSDGSGEPVEPGRFGGARGHVCLQSSPADDTTHVRSLSIRTSPGGTVRGRYPMPLDGPHRLYATLSPRGAAALTITPSVGEAARVEMTGDTGCPQRTVVADVAAGADSVELAIRPLDDAASATVSIHDAWLVGLPEALADLVRTSAAWTPADAAPDATPKVVPCAALCDGSAYGPAVLTIPVGGDAPETWRAEWPVEPPETPAILRGLVGLGADAAPDSIAKVSLKLVAPEREWPLMINLEVKAHPAPDNGSGPSPRDWPAVIEVELPTEAHGQECRVVLEVAAEAERAFSMAVPSLYVCSR